MASVAVFRRFHDFRVYRERILRIPMTPQTVAHAHRHILVDDIHSLNLPMASLAKNTGMHMGPVIEKHVVRQQVNPLPLQGLSRCIHTGQQLDIGPVHFGHLVTIHALFNRLDPGDTRFIGSRVTIEARHSEDSRVEFMGKWNWLRRLVSADKPIRLGKPAYPQDRE